MFVTKHNVASSFLRIALSYILFNAPSCASCTGWRFVSRVYFLRLLLSCLHFLSQARREHYERRSISLQSCGGGWQLRRPYLVTFNQAACKRDPHCQSWLLPSRRVHPLTRRSIHGIFSLHHHFHFPFSFHLIIFFIRLVCERLTPLACSDFLAF